jgi:hypothetical protein
LLEELEDVYDLALERAALEAFGGIYEAADIASRLSRQEVLERALGLMTEA